MVGARAVDVELKGIGGICWLELVSASGEPTSLSCETERGLEPLGVDDSVAARWARLAAMARGRYVARREEANSKALAAPEEGS